jgi:tRNA(Glu) U13 pseudouridine synthase TruD
LATAIESDHILLTFTLPAGCYATVLVREITKTVDLPTEEAC